MPKEDSTTTELLAIKNPEPLREIDAILAEYDKATADSTSARFETLALTSNAIRSLRERLPDALVKHIKDSSENNRLGFRSDRPDVGNGKARDGYAAGYPVPVIRDCMIEAVMRGAYPFGNEFNIVAGNAYITKEGFTGIMRRDRRFSDLRIECEVPNYEDARSGSDLRAIVPFTATWRFNGKVDSLKGNIPIRVNRGMGDDAILGKAERKIRGRIWILATGTSLSDGDADDAGSVGRAERAKPVKGEATSIERMTGGEAVDDIPYASAPAVEEVTKVTPAPSEAKANPSTGSAAANPKPTKAPTQAEPSQRITYSTPDHKEIFALCVKHHVLPEIVTEYAIGAGHAPEDARAVNEITEFGAMEIVETWSVILPGLKTKSAERKASER